MKMEKIPRRIQIRGQWYDVRQGWAGKLEMYQPMLSTDYTATQPYVHISDLYHVYDKSGSKVGEFHVGNNTREGAVESIDCGISLEEETSGEADFEKDAIQETEDDGTVDKFTDITRTPIGIAKRFLFTRAENEFTRMIKFSCILGLIAGTFFNAGQIWLLGQIPDFMFSLILTSAWVVSIMSIWKKDYTKKRKFLKSSCVVLGISAIAAIFIMVVSIIQYGALVPYGYELGLGLLLDTVIALISYTIFLPVIILAMIWAFAGYYGLYLFVKKMGVFIPWLILPPVAFIVAAIVSAILAIIWVPLIFVLFIIPFYYALRYKAYLKQSSEPFVEEDI